MRSLMGMRMEMRSMNRHASIAAILLMIAVMVACAPALLAQSDTSGRSVTGIVMDGDDHPIANAIVYLKNTKTSVVKTSYAEKDGGFRYFGLSTNVDYELHAEFNGKKSDIKTVSSFDARPKLKFNLRIK